MPITGQIVPSYLHPHTETFINDNTVFEEVVSPPQDGVRFICALTSSKGRDGVLLPFDVSSKYLEEYGNPNYKLFGQSGYMPYTALLTAQAKAWCMRVMPDDATYANVVVLAKAKVVEVDPLTPTDFKVVLDAAKFTFTWSAVVGATGYDIYEGVTKIASVGVVTTYDLTTIATGTHTYHIIGKNGVILSAPSEKTVITYNSDIVTEDVLNAFSTGAITTTSVVFNWKLTTAQVGVAFRLYKKLSTAGSLYSPTTVDISTGVFTGTMTGLTPDTGYTFKLSAYKDATEVVFAELTVDTAPVIPANTQLVIKHESVFIPDFADKTDFSTLVDAMATTVADSDGFKTYPLFGTYVLGRGLYGNDLRIRLSSDLQMDKDNGYKNFRIEVLDSVGGIHRKEIFSGSFFPDAVDSAVTSLFMNDVISDPDTGSTKMGMYVCETSFNDLLTLYKTSVDPTTTITMATFDVITGLTPAGVVIPTIEFTAGVNSVSLDNVEGLLLSGGDDGSFTYDVATLAERETAIDAAYIAAFEGTTDPKILSKRQTPAELILDACYSDEVKRALVGLMLKRYDAYGFVDAGLHNTNTSVINWATSFGSLGDRIFSKECQHYYIRDAFTGKSIPVTTTYFLAGQLPVHFKTVGKHVPLAGDVFGKLVGGIRGSLKPIVDADDAEIKEALYVARVNYFECIAENTFVRGTQGTSQLIWSDLSEENNMHVLLEMKRIVESMTASKRYQFAEAEDRKNFTEAADRVFSNYRGKQCRDAQVYFDMSAWEEERSIIHCYLSVIFRTMAKRGIVEIDINKRV